MTDRDWRGVAAILAVVLAVLAGATPAFVVFPGAKTTPSPASSFALGSAGSESPSASASSPASASASPSTPAVTASPTPAPTPVPTAQLTFTQMKLEPRVPANAGQPRFITFT